jgi:hypothetical protein
MISGEVVDKPGVVIRGLDARIHLYSKIDGFAGAKRRRSSMSGNDG